MKLDSIRVTIVYIGGTLMIQIVVHPQLSHSGFQRDDALMGVSSNILLLCNFNLNPILLQHLF